MKRNFIWILTSLMFSGLLGMTSMSLGSEDTWTTKADMPAARWGLSTSVVNGKIYAIGGKDSGIVSTMEEYDPETDTWTAKANMPTARNALATAVVNGKIYAIGGWDSLFLSTVEAYDPVMETWTKKADMPTPRDGFPTSVVNGKIYAIGGISGGEGEEKVLSTVEEYDPATDTWTKKADMPTARCYLSTDVVAGKIYAIGGLLTLSGTARSSVEQYDPATNTWTTKVDMPTARCFLSTSAVNGKIYAIGGSVIGWPWSLTSTVEEYDTGFVPEVITSVGAKGKLPTTWGEIKRSR